MIDVDAARVAVSSSALLGVAMPLIRWDLEAELGASHGLCERVIMGVTAILSINRAAVEEKSGSSVTGNCKIKGNFRIAPPGIAMALQLALAANSLTWIWRHGCGSPPAAWVKQDAKWTVLHSDVRPDAQHLTRRR